MINRFRTRPLFVLLPLVIVAYCIWTAFSVAEPAAQMSPIMRDQALKMLRDTHEALRKNYYDGKFHGVDLDGRMKEAEKKIQSAKSLSEALGVIAWDLDALNDSHTFFIPPRRPFDIQNGYEYGYVGDNCFITAVEKGSDAAAQNIKPGDQVLSIEGFHPTREASWKLHYAFNSIAPRSAVHFVLASPGGQPRQLEVKSSVVKLRQVIDLTIDPNSIWDIIRQIESSEHEIAVRHVAIGEVDIEKIPEFEFEDGEVERILNRASHYPALVLDLRGNPGGQVDLLEHMLGGLFDHEVKIGDRIGRKELKPQMAKTHGARFKGKLVVLVDSGSASAAELLARVVQLEKRGTVIGDRSSGSVMEAKWVYFGAGVSGDYGYAVSVTQADLVMSDGKSLEHNGVTPDVLALPTAEDLAAERDPVLAKAVESLGGKIAPEAAGKLFPVVWHKPMAW